MVRRGAGRARRRWRLLPAKGTLEQCYERFSRQSMLVPGVSASTMVEKFIRACIDDVASRTPSMAARKVS